MAISTIQDIIEESYSKHGVPEPTPVQLQRGLDLANNIILSINTEFAVETPVGTYTALSDAFSLTSNWRRFLIAWLAYDLGENLDSKAIETLYQTALIEKEILRREYYKLSDTDVSTSKELLVSALNMLGIKNPTTAELNHALTVCNNIIQTWNKEFGLDTPITEFTDLTTTLASISMGDEVKRPLIYATAVDLAFNYDKEAKIQALYPIALENKLLLKKLNSRYVTDFEADTVKEIIICAYRKIGKPNPDTIELNHALTGLNNMIGLWASEMGLFYTESFSALTDSIATYPLHWRDPLIYNLAVKLAEDYPEKPINPTVYQEAKRLKGLLNALEYVEDEPLIDAFLRINYNRGTIFTNKIKFT